ncbi:MAG TPA: ornithine cyclodeaminase family protein [Burkholderiales bacterium]|nr:ornithine cyclodeaminase family protein [Burkholderiales bacterium]
MSAQAIWITEAEVVQLMDLKEAIVALEVALREEARGEAQNMTKTLLQYGKNNLHAIGGKLGNLVGTKTWAHTQGGTCPLLLLWSAEDGSLVAVIEAFALGNLRTGGISGVAAEWMARKDAKVMAIVGTGKQALAQVGAMLAVRPIEKLRIHSPREDSRQAFAAKAREEFGIETVTCASAGEACMGAQVVTLVTRAAQPFLTAGMLDEAAHLNAVGAIAPDREEFAQDVFARATLVAVDNLPGVQQLSREFMTRYAPSGWDEVMPLSGLIASGRRRSVADDISLFKAMGMGISDLALGVELLKRARERGAGRAIPQPKKTKPRLAGARAKNPV